MIPPFTLRNAEEVKGAIFISAIAGLILWAVLWTILYELRIRRWLNTYNEHHLPAKGKVISVVTVTNRNYIIFRYRFTAINGKEYQGSQRFSQLLATQEKIAFAVGDEISIVYNPDNPKLNYIEGHLNYYQRSETSYIQSFISLAIFMVSFSYTASMIWPFVITLAFSLFLGVIKIAIHAKKR